MFIPDPDLDFFPNSDLGVKKAPDPGYGSATLQSTGTVLYSVGTAKNVVPVQENVRKAPPFL
jgi:hypothetical protein